VLAATLSEDGAYPFTAYAVFEDLQLAQWGNSLPTVETLIKVRTGETLAELCGSICAAAGIDVDEERLDRAPLGAAGAGLCRHRRDCVLGRTQAIAARFRDRCCRGERANSLSAGVASPCARPSRSRIWAPIEYGDTRRLSRSHFAGKRPQPAQGDEPDIH
jgi:hypothetical protein